MLERFIIEDAKVGAARSGGEVLTFLSQRDADDMAEQWAFAGAHLGADWQVRELTQDERAQLAVSNYTRIKGQS